MRGCASVYGDDVGSDALPALSEPPQTHKIISIAFVVRSGFVAPNVPLARGILKQMIAVYPGSFDPVTNGHLDLER